MKAGIRVVLLVLALAGFLVFFSFHIENVGPVKTITVGLNTSPWFKWSRIKGVGEFGESTKFDFVSWSVAGLAAGIVLLIVRSRVKG